MPHHTCNDLTRDLKKMGVESRDTLFIHSSFKSLGTVEGGAEAVVHALEACIGEEGLLLMPSFNLVEHERRAETWDHNSSPSTVGWITEYFRGMAGTHRSDHYSHSVSARGQGAEAFVADHRSQKGLESPWDKKPWGKTYGIHSPMVRAYERDGKLLMFGVDYDSSTYIHLVEVRYWHRLRAGNPQAAYPALSRPGLGAFWDRAGEPNRRLVGDAECRLFRIRMYVDGLLAEVEREPERYLSSP